MGFASSDIILNRTGPNEKRIAQITSLSHNQGAELSTASATGAPSPAAQFVSAVASVTGVTTTDASLFEMNSGLWLSRGWCADDGVAGGVAQASIVPFSVRSNCAILDNASVHSSFASRHTMTIPTSVSGTKGEPIEIQLDLRYLSLDPFEPANVVLPGQALSPSQFVSVSQFAGAYIGGVQMKEVVSFTYNPGITVLSEPVGGGAYVTTGFLTEISPTIELVTENLDESLAVLNGADLGAGLTIYMAKKQPGAIIEPKTNPVHSSITALNGIRQTSSLTSSQGQNGSGTITVSLASPTGGDAISFASGIQLP